VSLVVLTLCQGERRLDLPGTRVFTNSTEHCLWASLGPAAPARRSREGSLVVPALHHGKVRLDRLGTRDFASPADARRCPPLGPAPTAWRSREATPAVRALNCCWPRPNLLHSSPALSLLCQFSCEIGSAPMVGWLLKRPSLHPHPSVWLEHGGFC